MAHDDFGYTLTGARRSSSVGKQLSIKFFAALSVVLVSACGGGQELDGRTSKATETLAVTSVDVPRRYAPKRAQSSNPLESEQEAAASLLLKFAEGHFSSYFPSAQANRFASPFLYRHYPETSTYVGVVIVPDSGWTMSGVYVMGGPFGADPLYVGQLTDFVTPTAAPVVSSFAGSGRGSIDGPSNLASFNYPYGVAIDVTGNLFVADYASSLVRKVTPEGNVSTLAGGAGLTGFGFADGMGADASFSGPNGLAVDSIGNVFVADEDNSAIRKITPGGRVSTIATRMNGPRGVAVDSKGNVFVASYWGHGIFKVSSSGVVSTFAGGTTFGFSDGLGSAARFVHPQGIAIDAYDNVFVADTGNNSIRKITPGGVVSTLAGGRTSGFIDSTGSEARFSYPTGVAVDGLGNVLVADHDNHAVRKITPEGVVSTLAGGGDYGLVNGAGDLAKFKQPRGIAIDGAGKVFVTDSGNHVVRMIVP